MNWADVGTLSILAVGGLLMACGATAVWQGYDYSNRMGSYLHLAYFSTDMDTFTYFMERYLDSVRAEGATDGQTLLWFQTPNSDAGNYYRLAEGALKRARDLRNTSLDALTKESTFGRLKENLAHIDVTGWHYVHSGLAWSWPLWTAILSLVYLFVLLPGVYHLGDWRNWW